MCEFLVGVILGSFKYWYQSFSLLFLFPFSIYFTSVEPLPVTSVSIYDYKPSPETGVLFEIHYPEKYNVFTRVNISYWEGKDFRTMLYKGKQQKEGWINDDPHFLAAFPKWCSLLLQRGFIIHYLTYKWAIKNNYWLMKIMLWGNLEHLVHFLRVRCHVYSMRNTQIIITYMLLFPKAACLVQEINSDLSLEAQVTISFWVW